MIRIEEFNAGGLRKGSGYRYFAPNRVCDAWSWQDTALNVLLEKAALRLGELDALARFLPDIDLLVQLQVTREAVASSRIEGTRTSIDEALLPESEIDPERRDDWKEVRNYIHALNQAIALLDTLPLSGRLLRHTHRTLLTGVRGEHKLPGEYRRSQNWIGGLSLSDAVFIPPHSDLVEELMSDLERFLHDEDNPLPHLLRIGIAHYQFETIHPFLDGNGRMGRLLITLYLVDRGLLHKPLLQVSTFFERERALYYDNLMRVRTRHDLRQWLAYFLTGMEEAAARTIASIRQALSIRERTEALIRESFGRRSSSGLLLLQALLRRPTLTVDEAASATGLSFKAANDLVDRMQSSAILREITGKERNRIFVFEEYLDAFRERRS